LPKKAHPKHVAVTSVTRYDLPDGVATQLRSVNCDFLTVGQYLRPTTQNVEVVEYIHPDIFEEYKQLGEKMGFRFVASAPFVRSSFHAEDALIHIKKDA
jgi:lipoate synthase